MALLCFTLLGLWWAVVAFRKHEWLGTPHRRRIAYIVSLGFMVPGAMSLLALDVTTEPVVWRSSFVLGGAIGGVSALTALNDLRKEPRTTGVQLGVLASAVLYLIVAVGAVVPNLPASLGTSLTPLQLEGILLSLLVLAGSNVAWLLFMGSAPPTEE
jgi:hypothetical protein